MDDLGPYDARAGETWKHEDDEMATVETSIHIDRPVDDVYAYATDVETMTEWLSALVEAEELTDRPLGVGTRIRTVSRLLGRHMESVIEVTAFEPGARFAIKGATGSFKNHSTFTFESVGGGTRVTDIVEMEVSGILGLAEPLMARMLRRQFEANLAALKERLEAQDTGGD